MNGAQDLGGRMGFGPVEPEQDEPVFHADWEARVFALTMAMGVSGAWNIDASRFARESLPPAVYLTASYYSIWLQALERMLLERGLVSSGELARGQPAAPGNALPRRPDGEAIGRLFAAGWRYDRPAPAPARFAAGDRVRCANDHLPTHTRLPGYLRGRTGEIVGIRGCHVYPDSNAHGGGENPAWLYSVRFEARELWGSGADPATEVIVDCWEPYLAAL
jgi:nitrile hydratase